MFKQTKVFEQMKRAVFVERAGAVGTAARGRDAPRRGRRAVTADDEGERRGDALGAGGEGDLIGGPCSLISRSETARIGNTKRWPCASEARRRLVAIAV